METTCTYVPVGTKISVRKGTVGPFTTITTTKELPVPADANPLNDPEWCHEMNEPMELFFEAHGYQVVVQESDIQIDELSDGSVRNMPVAPKSAAASPGPKAQPAAPKCRRCGGKGHISAYNHVQGGVCFACGGKGVRGVAVAV